MFMLWCCADADMLASGNAYRLSNTGAGLLFMIAGCCTVQLGCWAHGKGHVCNRQRN
jgi:hypothetical protein